MRPLMMEPPFKTAHHNTTQPCASTNRCIPWGSGRLVLSCTDTNSGDTIVENAVVFDSNAFFFVKPGEEIELNHQVRGDPNLMYVVGPAPASATYLSFQLSYSNLPVPG